MRYFSHNFNDFLSRACSNFFKRIHISFNKISRIVSHAKGPFCHKICQLLHYRHNLCTDTHIKAQSITQDTYLLKCVFFFNASNTFGCNFPIASSIFESFVLFFFLSLFSACCFSCLLCLRLLRNILTERSKTVPDVNGL